MKQICVTCDGKLKNTGRSSQDKTFGLDRALIYVPLKAADGTVNSLDLTAPNLDTELLGKFNHADPTKRWYLVKDVQAVTTEEAEAAFETSPTNERFKLMDGIQNFNFGIWGISRAYFNQIRTMCVEFGIIRVDDCGNMLGEVNDDETEFFPREVNNFSYSARFQSKTADASPKAIVDFDFDRDTNEGNQVMLDINSFTINPLRMSSMLPATIEVVSVDTATEVTVKIALIYGTAGNRIPVIGTTLGDLRFIDKATGTDFGSPLVSVATTGTDGEYKITTPAVTTGNVYQFVLFKQATAEREQGIESNIAEYTSL